MELKGVARQATGKLFLVLAGCGTLVLLIFVVLPWMTPPEELVEPPQAMAPQEIVAEVLGESVPAVGNEVDEQPADAAGEGATALQRSAEDAMMPGPSPLVAVRNDGEELPVVFPGRGPGADEGETPDDTLPPPLTPEEIEAAVPEPPTLEREADRTADNIAPTGTPEVSAPQAIHQVTAATDEAVQKRWHAAPGLASTLTAVEHPTGASPAAVREVQSLLKELSYNPGPVDGVWGERTAAAWQAFAAEAGGLAKALAVAAAGGPSDVRMPPGVEEHQPAELVSAYPESRSPVEVASPSEAPPLEEASGAVQAGNPPPGPPAQGVVMESTLRGVMGYRMPLVSRQELPDQVVSGVLIPAHTTFVILRPGYWELTGLSPDDVAHLRDAVAKSEAEARTVKPEAQSAPVRRGWNPLRIFRRQVPSGE